ncbi:hypothetical protein LDO51_06635 [Providencia alcalifaciens]|uniref:hypothetical protein n=1 Tax=Providencia alcalifaciens TaxID=126385 RepID=UPI001CE03BBC|nr:hypothetical protein [Providencia alcalifaciens]UBX50457.1 hypothetical protein LDO51_06635 [Providencia alcalifaciens]
MSIYTQKAGSIMLQSCLETLPSERRNALLQHTAVQYEIGVLGLYYIRYYQFVAILDIGMAHSLSNYEFGKAAKPVLFMA